MCMQLDNCMGTYALPGDKVALMWLGPDPKQHVCIALDPLFYN